MEIEVRTLPLRRAVALRHVGPYWQIGVVFQRVGQWAQSQGLCGPLVGLYHDDPRVVPPAELRSDAGVFVPDDFAAPGGDLSLIELPAGPCAIATHRGSYEGLPAAWPAFLAAFTALGRTRGEGPSYEVYLNDCAVTPPEELLTELCIPLAG